MQEHLFRHFSSPGLNVSVTFIHKTDPSDPLKREIFWRQTLMTMAPYWLKIEDSASVLPIDNIGVGASNFTYILHFMDYWNGLLMEDEFV